jgi:signal transduction histidine kinase
MLHRGKLMLRSSLFVGLLVGPLASLLLATPGLAAERQDPANVLLAYAQRRLLPALVDLDESIRSTIQAQSSRPVIFHTEFLDLDGGREAAYEEKLLELLRLKYAGDKPDLIVSGTSRALRFLLAHRDALFPAVPIVFTTVEKKTGVDFVLPADVTGVWLEIDWRGTLEAALQLQPQTRRVVVVGGTTDNDRLWIRRAREAFAGYKGGVEFTYLTDLPMRQLLKEVAGLPDGTIILFFTLLRDGAGHDFIPKEVLSRLSAAARVPIYGPSETQIGLGAVGGRVTSFRAQGVKAAELGLRALRGLPGGPADIVEAETALMFDWRQLKRWGLSENRLPAGSQVLYRPPSSWDLYKWPIIGIVAIALVEALLIGALLIQRAWRRRAESALDERLRFETLLADLSAILSHLPAGEVERQIDRALRRLVEGLGVDRASLAEVTPGTGLARFTHSWALDGVAPVPSAVERGGFPWTVKRAQQGHIVFFARLDELPLEAETDRQSYLGFGIKSLVAIPLTIGGSVVGVLTCGHLRSEREWPEVLVHRLGLLGDIFANALSRKQSETAVLESKALASTIFTSLYGHVAAVDRDGVIIAVNESWTRFARENGGDPARASVGTSYLQVLRGAINRGDTDARRALEAVEAVLEGRARQAVLEYACPSGDAARWFEMAVEPFRRPQGGAIISHVDITQRRRAEEEARRQREELAHALRVTTMGELAGSLAHEINQPLAVIVTSAQAAQRLLDGGRPDRAELRGALTDIADQGKHAAQVIGRLRALFRKADSELQLLDVGELVTGMAGLVRHDVERRGIAMTLDCPPGLPPVSGDSIQLQQVVLNLLVNACEAMSTVEGPRDLIVATRARAGVGIELTISDTGLGLKESEVERIFEPFLTTKASGLGMGLAISRSIISAHGGRIWVTRNPDRGITAHVELPSKPVPGA